MILCKGQSACEAMGSGGMSPGNFKIWCSKIEFCGNFNLSSDRLSNTSIASNKVYHFSKNLTKVYFVLPSIQALSYS